MKVKTKLDLGDIVEDKITGFQGTVTGFSCYITGCYQFLVVPKCKDNKKENGAWFDEGRLEKVKDAEIKKEDCEAQTTGCDLQAPTKS